LTGKSKLVENSKHILPVARPATPLPHAYYERSTTFEHTPESHVPVPRYTPSEVANFIAFLLQCPVYMIIHAYYGSKPSDYHAVMVQTSCLDACYLSGSDCSLTASQDSTNINSSSVVANRSQKQASLHRKGSWITSSSHPSLLPEVTNRIARLEHANAINGAMTRRSSLVTLWNTGSMSQPLRPVHVRRYISDQNRLSYSPPTAQLPSPAT
jgi:hypothetical protein